MIEIARRFKTLPKIGSFYDDLSVSGNPLVVNCESTYDSTDLPQPDDLTLFTTLYDLSVSYNSFSKAKVRQLGASGTKGLIPLKLFSIDLSRNPKSKPKETSREAFQN